MKTVWEINLDELERRVETRDILKNYHKSADLFIYSYNKVWYDDWTPELLWSRGLILNSKFEIVSVPFMKFFNYAEVKEECDRRLNAGMKYKVQDKVDGSLGILFNYNDKWILSTKGSFHSDQAVQGKVILDRMYPGYKSLDKNFTYLFEIVYPENQIVVKYDEDMVFLDAFGNTKDNYYEKPEIPESFNVVKEYNHFSIEDILSMMKNDYDNSEGFVVVFEDGYRVKFKYEEYIRLHKIVSDFKPKSVVELLASGANLDDFINSLPDEFRKDILAIKNSAEEKFERLLKYSKFVSKTLKKESESRKEYAVKVFEAFKSNNTMQSLLFILYNYPETKNIDKIIWKEVLKEIEAEF